MPALHLLAWLAVAQLPDGGPTPAATLIDATTAQEFVQEKLADGTHVRFGTAKQGPVHVWWPRTYHPATADTVVYLHGFYTDVDQAFLDHQLAEQFRDSGRNALFIAVQTRSWVTDGLGWDDLEALLTEATRRAHVKRPAGGITVVGHSGAYKTAAAWLGHPKLHRVVLVDGLYGNDGDFVRWVEGAAGRQVVLVGFETAERAERVLPRKLVVRLDELPRLYDPLPAAAQSAKILCLQSQRFTHMELVTDGRVLPWVLHTLR
jgi:hypothetical protein